MSSSKLIKLALIFIVTGSVIFFIGKSMGGNGFYMNSSFQLKSISDYEYLEYSDMELEPFSKVKVDISDCPITVRKSENGSYGIAVKRYVQSKDNMVIEAADGTLSVKEREFSWISWNLSFNFHDKQEYVIIYLPESEYKELNLNTTNAKIEVQDVPSVQKLNIDTSNGSVNIENLPSVRELNVETSNASVELNEISCESAAIDTSNGTVKAADITVTKLLNIDTNNASIETELNGQESDYNIHADTSNADIYINGRKEASEYKSKKGDVKIKLDTSNGKIEIKFQ